MKLPDGLERVSWLTWPIVLVIVQQLFFPAPAGALLAGVILGLITSLVSLGMYLVFRANRVLNFTAGELGLLPAVLTVMLVIESGMSWYLGFGIGFLAAAVLGVAVEFLIIRRFFDAPRLVVTVATIGVAQLIGVCALFLPGWWGARVQSQRIDAPFAIDFEIGSRVFNANHVIALVLAPLAMIGVGILLRSTRIGVAIRASAELPSRAAMLGIPVKGLQSVVWSVATVLGFIALFLRAGVYGLPVGGALGLLLLLRSLAALTLGRLIHLPTIIAASIALGILQEAVVWNSGAIEAEAKMGAITGVVIVVALLLRRTRGVRSEMDTSSWQNAGDVRPIADVYRSLPLVRIGRIVGILAFAVAFLVFPTLFGTTVVVRMALIFLFAITFMSLGVLTGWAGQLSLGQMAFAGVGAATSAWLTQRWHWDITLATLSAGAIGALVSLVVGVPALRLRGVYLAVTTLAFAITVSGYFLNPRFFDWLPSGRIERNPIFGVVDWSSSTAIYYVSLIGMLLAFGAVRGIRKSRTGRVLIALRDNEAAVESYGVSPVRAKLTAFAISGFLAAFAGSLVVHHQQAFVVDDAQFNLLVFSGAVIGGLGSPLGAFFGSLYFNGTFFWLKGSWRLLASGIGLLGILLVAPGGLTGLWYDLRDLTLRWVGARQGIVEGDRAEDLLGHSGDGADDVDNDDWPDPDPDDVDSDVEAASGIGGT
ncbi:ABC transporter permease [Ilumatobacter nonamiensis]|uniref:ABC transporter permease n=1 Tax=Ilumatobacter nonamiensis TaxID=467093 RepID=UPI00034C9794|nr:ABC transporter permease [Ilumatobacter nonamiensis]